MTRSPHEVKQVVNNDGLDIKSASAGPGRHRLRAVRLAALARSENAPTTARSISELAATLPKSGRTSRRSSPSAFRAAGHFSDRRAGGLRGPRRDLDRARREGRHPQPDQHPRRGRARPRLVAGRQVYRLPFRRVGRVRASHSRSERARRSAQDRAWAIRPRSITRPAGRRTRRRSPTPTSG